MAKLAGSVALVTGAANGIGRATALLFAREGASVVATDVDRAGADAVTAEIVAAGGSAFALAHDVAREDAWESVVAEIGARFGRLDILVNNAGIVLVAPVTEMALADWRRIMAVNLDGTFLGVKHALPLIRAGGGGSIVNVSSTAGLTPSPNASAYAASKAGVRLFTKSVALECGAARDGVRVNSIHPGIVETPLWDGLIGTTADGANGRPRAETLAAREGGAIPLGRAATADEIAQGILWLASADSSYVTGTELVIDGGRSIA